jgi:hypothetical protein
MERVGVFLFINAEARRRRVRRREREVLAAKGAKGTRKNGVGWGELCWFDGVVLDH